MAKETIVRLTDDLDGTPADEEVMLALDNVAYTIDLSEKNAAKLRTALAPYIESARKAGSETRRGRGGPRTSPALRESDKERNQAVRAWSLEQGVQLSPRGRIANGVYDAFDADDPKALHEAVGLEWEEPSEDKPKRQRKNAEPEFSEAAA